MDVNTLVNGLAVDPKSLGDLKARSVRDPDGTLLAAAKQFETLFLDMMMKSMRKSAAGDSLFDNEGSRVFTDLLDHEYSRKLADQGGLGLANLLVQQLSKLKDTSTQADASVKKSTFVPISTQQRI